MIICSHLLDGVRRSVELDGVLHQAGELAGGGAEAGDVGLTSPCGARGWQRRATLTTALTNDKTHVIRNISYLNELVWSRVRNT